MAAEEISMTTKTTVLAALAAAALICGAPAAAQNAQQLVERYTDLAGSQQNSKALVTGLRDAMPFTLTGDKTSATIDPPTRKMGYGNVDNALALTRASLQKQGITDPTPEQLKSSLMGVLGQRADGRGWGEIAHSMGFKLGELKREQHRPERIARVGHERPEKPERLEKPERPDKAERPQR
jgi:hypothetical protein